MTDLHDLTLAQASDLIRDKELSPVEYTDALIARSEALQPQLFAFITPTFEHARQSAKAVTEEIATGNYRGPLHGVPFAVKDIYDTAGILTTGHSRTCIDRVPDKDSTCVHSCTRRARSSPASSRRTSSRTAGRRSTCRGRRRVIHGTPRTSPAAHRPVRAQPSRPGLLRSRLAPIPAVRSARRPDSAASPA